MKSQLHRIEIRNFKAFREFALDLEGRHLLVYGSNGSGKSSLYWALYTFLQSAKKPTPSVSKYFDAADAQNLLNIHEQDEATPMPGEIALSLRDVATKNVTTYRISQTVHGTHKQPDILKGDLASDFITYRFFFGFSHFRNSENFNIWPLFEKEILPFCVSTGGQVPLDMWMRIHGGNPNPSGARGLGGRTSYEAFRKKTEAFAAVLPGIVDAISTEAQRFYDKHFAADDPAEVKLKLGVTTLPSFKGTNQNNRQFTIPVIEFGIQVGGKTVTRPQSFLNEAKLTQLALCVRFAASLVNLHESDLKLLVLDDLLVSLDMSNRMKVVEILLSDTFTGYQKIILTHELGLFQEFRRKVGASHPEWCFLRLQGSAAKSIGGKSEKTEMQRAEEYLHGHALDEAALCLRKAAEDMARRWREWVDKKSVPPGTFYSLTENLRAAKNRLVTELPLDILEKVVESTPKAHRTLLVATDDTDVDGNVALDAATKGILKSKRNRLRQAFTGDHDERMRRIRLIDEILACTERVLNPAAHSGATPLYEKEVQDALKLIKDLEVSLSP
ncbi:AAA family ATPase [Mesorhizobium sp. M0991]|uniref:AAA family ATPase n=1 Tax=Mesorhizobium sp. M0991 TaxID=2957043 RepID=UPI0033394441